jgi:hypothetical protein
VPQPWRLLARIMSDSMPLLRKMAISMAACNGTCTAEQLQVRMGVSLPTAKRVIEDLELHGVLVQEKGFIKLSPWMLDNNAVIIYRSIRLSIT